MTNLYKIFKENEDGAMQAFTNSQEVKAYSKTCQLALIDGVIAMVNEFILKSQENKDENVEEQLYQLKDKLLAERQLINDNK